MRRLVPRVAILLLLPLELAAQRQEAGDATGDSRAVYRSAEARRGENLDEAITLYRRYVAMEPGDAWGHLALASALADRGDLDAARRSYDHARALAPRARDTNVERARMLARAGFAGEAVRAYEAWLAIDPADAESRRELARARSRAAGWAEPSVQGTRDSDGISTWQTAASLVSPDLGPSRATATATYGAAGDGAASRSVTGLSVGASFRPSAALTVDVSAGFERVDRAFIDTAAASPGSGAGPGSGSGGGSVPRQGPQAPIGRGPSRASLETIPIAQARLRWRDRAARFRIDGRLSRQVLDASPYLVAQGVRRDEAGAELDLRIVGPLRARAFGRVGAVHNESERNERRILGAALAWAPRTADLSLRAQQLSYGGPTGLAYFAPRYVRTIEATAYVERERGDVVIALDAGFGAQQVSAWTAPPTEWSPTARAWAQVTRALTARLSLGGEIDLYDARVGTDMPSFEAPGERWRYGSVRAWIRARL